MNYDYFNSNPSIVPIRRAYIAVIHSMLVVFSTAIGFSSCYTFYGIIKRTII